MIKAEGEMVEIKGSTAEVSAELIAVICSYMLLTEKQLGEKAAIALLHKVCEMATTEWVKESMDGERRSDDVS